MKKQKEKTHEGITWSEMGKQNVQAEKVYCFVTLLGYIIYIILTFAHLGGCWFALLCRASFREDSFTSAKIFWSSSLG